MPLQRSATHKVQKPSINTGFSRSTSTRVVRGRYVDISSPIELISTTNMQAYTAPSLRHVSSSSSNSSSSDLTDDGHGSVRTAATSPTPSIPSVPACPAVKLPTAVVSRQASQTSQTSVPNFSRNSAVSALVASMNFAPPVPLRAATHTVERHRTLSRQRSPSRLSQPPVRIDTTLAASSNPQQHRGESSPFERELEQVDELVKTFSKAQKAESAEEDEIIQQKGLLRFSADVYMAEICLPFQFTWI